MASGAPCCARAICGDSTRMALRAYGAPRISLAHRLPVNLSSSPQAGFDVAAVDGEGGGGGFGCSREIDEGIRDVFGGHFAAEQVGAHVAAFREAPRLAAR